MSDLLLWMLAVCAVSGSAGLVAHEAHVRRSRRNLVSDRMVRDLTLGLAASRKALRPRRSRWLRHINRRLLSAGVQPVWWHAIVGSGCLASSAALGMRTHGPFGGAIALATCIAGFYAWTEWLSGRRRALLLAQLPAFLDHLMRAVESGSSVQQALRIAAEEAPQPLTGVFERVNRKIQLGADLEDAMEQLELFRMRELSMIALTIRVNQRFGGPIRDLLRNVITNVHQQDRSRRELRALTGETRLSAWVLGILPAAIAFYISSVNPTYVQGMLADPTGRTLLYCAATFQLLGSVVLWRMVKSV